MNTMYWYRLIVPIMLLAVFLLLLLYPPVQRSRPVGGIDEGRLFLAGATALLQDGEFPITQRTPLYSLMLAATGKITGVDPAKTIPGAREYGSIDKSDVASGFLAFPYQRFLLWIQFSLWLISLWLLYLIIVRSGAELRLHAVAATALFIPLSWLLITYIYDPILTQLLLLTGTFFFICWLAQPESWKFAAVAAIAFSICALSRPTFQLVVPLVAAAAFLITRKSPKRKAAMLRLGMMMILWFVIVGGYSLRNYVRHNFFGVSSAFGLSMTGRAAYFIEKAEPYYPQEVAAFIEIRNEKGNLWGARGIKWLMLYRGMTWPQANLFMTKVSLIAISHAPMRYLVEAGKSLITFHMPYALRGPRKLVVLLYVFDFVITSAFLLSTMFWISYHLLGRMTPLIAKPAWSDLDSVILILQIIYWYCAAISCGVDYGKPEHRYAVFFILPAMLVLFAARFQIRKGSGIHEDRQFSAAV